MEASFLRTLVILWIKLRFQTSRYKGPCKVGRLQRIKFWPHHPGEIPQATTHITCSNQTMAKTNCLDTAQASKSSSLWDKACHQDQTLAVQWLTWARTSKRISSTRERVQNSFQEAWPTRPYRLRWPSLKRPKRWLRHNQETGSLTHLSLRGRLLLQRSRSSSRM